METHKTLVVQETLQKPTIHNEWKSSYRAPGSERFYGSAFDYVATFLDRSSPVLDVGCGSCAHSVRLAIRGYSVMAVDLSESALQMAEANISRFQDRIRLGQENLLDLSFSNETYDSILCWGVLMHVPQLEFALSELVRVLRPGGILVISESNRFSVHVMVKNALRMILGTYKGVGTATGIENWIDTPDGPLLTRQANIGWLKRQLAGYGLVLISRSAGEFTDAYVMTSSRFLRRLIHSFNYLWFKYVGIPHLALGNILIFSKPSAEQK